MRKIALIGTAPSGIHGPYNDPSWEIWGVGMRASYVTRADRWFELHRLAGETAEWVSAWRAHIREWAKDCEIWMLYPEKLGPKIVTYPNERIAKRFGTYFMTSTFSWMMALALDELRPVKGKRVNGEIGLWGVDMEYGTEYRHQRAGLRHFMDLARVLDIKVTRLSSGGLAYEPTPYPLVQDDPLIQKLEFRKEGTNSRLHDFEGTLTKTKTLIAENGKAITELERAKADKKYDFDVRLRELRQEVRNLMSTAERLSTDLVRATGEKEAYDWLEDYLRP